MKLIYDGTTLEGTPEEIKEMMTLMGAEFAVNETEKVEEETPTFKEGDRVKALVVGEFRDIKAGEVGTIDYISEKARKDGDPFYIAVETDDDFDYFRPQDLELVTPKPTTIKRKARVGERILITKPFIACDKYKEGDQFTVTKAYKEIPGMNGHVTVEGIGLVILDSEYEVIVEEKEDSKRKPGEFKKGDIVRVKWILGKGNVDVIAEIYEGPEGDGAGGNYYLNDGEEITLGNDCELIAPVEARLDV
ncbi:hypothetical protein [Lederbergia citri]|uniref:Uncharacterized protein n=1 Tax=Lederbergia citri TaxID=2833580 RepID=A0A942TF46_9BACI|nr:hypothetical protein [Lederbergia citri]MBS4195372.1 hypothetical protein [Lederbergia citri]